MALTLESAARLLDRHGLLREIIRGDVWTLDPHDIKGFDEPFSAITYDTRKVEPGTFLCCKGRFKAEYLQGIDAALPPMCRRTTSPTPRKLRALLWMTCARPWLCYRLNSMVVRRTS